MVEGISSFVFIVNPDTCEASIFFTYLPVLISGNMKAFALNDLKMLTKATYSLAISSLMEDLCFPLIGFLTFLLTLASVFGL